MSFLGFSAPITKSREVALTRRYIWEYSPKISSRQPASCRKAVRVTGRVIAGGGDGVGATVSNGEEAVPLTLARRGSVIRRALVLREGGRSRFRGRPFYLEVRRSGTLCSQSASSARAAAMKGRGWSRMTWWCACGISTTGALRLSNSYMYAPVSGGTRTILTKPARLCPMRTGGSAKRLRASLVYSLISEHKQRLWCRGAIPYGGRYCHRFC